MQVLQLFVSETRGNRSREYFVSESWGAPPELEDFFEKIRFLPLSYLNIDAVNQRNWSLYIKLRLEYFVIVK